MIFFIEGRAHSPEAGQRETGHSGDRANYPLPNLPTIDSLGGQERETFGG